MKTNLRRCKSFSDFEQACLHNYSYTDENGDYHFNQAFPEVEEAWAAARNVDDFIRRLLSREDLADDRQYYGVIASRRMEPCDAKALIHRRLSGVSDFCCTGSDAGSARVVFPGMELLIPNGYGDGTTDVYAVNDSVPGVSGFASHVLKYTGTCFTLTEDAFVATTDCGMPIPAMILHPGRYMAYNLLQTVVFVRQEA